MDSWGILNVDTAAAAISRDDTGTSFRRKNLVSMFSLFLYIYLMDILYLLTTHNMCATDHGYITITTL